METVYVVWYEDKKRRIYTDVYKDLDTATQNLAKKVSKYERCGINHADYVE